jgi:hypothetical protein
MEQMYEAVRYAADGHAGELDPADPAMSDGAVLARGSLEECRSAIMRRILPDLHGIGGGLMTDAEAERLRRARWSGPDGSIEAYHESDEEGCGGWAIRPVQA